MTPIKFGTDGWRGIIGQDFNLPNAQLVAQAIARYIVRAEDSRRGVLIGYDHRYESDTIAASIAGKSGTEPHMQTV